MTAKDELKYYILKKSVPNTIVTNDNILYHGTTCLKNYLDFVQSVLGFYYCRSKCYTIYGSDAIITWTADYYLSYTEFFVAANINSFGYQRTFIDSTEIPIIYIVSSILVLGGGKMLNKEIQLTYLQQWPLLLLIYCLERKDNHKIFIF